MIDTAQRTTSERYGSGHDAIDNDSIVTDVEVIVEEAFFLDGNYCDTADEATGAFRKSVHFFIDNFSNFYESGLVGVWMRSDTSWAADDHSGEPQDLRDEDGDLIFRRNQSSNGPKVVLTKDSVRKLIKALAMSAHLKVEIEKD